MIDSLVQTLLDRFRAKKHMRESDEGDRVGAGATHVFSPLELLGMDDPAVPVHTHSKLIRFLMELCCRVLVQATTTGKLFAVQRLLQHSTLEMLWLLTLGWIKC